MNIAAKLYSFNEPECLMTTSNTTNCQKLVESYRRDYLFVGAGVSENFRPTPFVTGDLENPPYPSPHTTPPLPSSCEPWNNKF